MGPGVGREGRCDHADCTCDALSSPCPSCCLPTSNRTEAPCTVGADVGCYESDGQAPPLLPIAHTELHDHVTLENCATRCFADNLSVAGIRGGNHCSCGEAAALATAAARQRKRALGECQPQNCSMRYGDGCACTGNPTERCGTAARMLAFTFSCTKPPPV
jgi:hypothetical protein